MQDQPAPDEILAAIAAFLRNSVILKTDPHTAFQARVAANALDLVRRQLELGAPGEDAELKRLQALLGHAGTLPKLNAELADALASGAKGLATPGVSAHLSATTLEKLRVDQPNYSGYRAALERSSDLKET
jgi:DNA-binding response OmpR family regulator